MSKEELRAAILEREEAVWGKGNVYFAEDIGVSGNEVWYTVMVRLTGISPVKAVAIEGVPA
jgi:hypothetical protein